VIPISDSVSSSSSSNRSFVWVDKHVIYFDDEHCGGQVLYQSQKYRESCSLISANITAETFIYDCKLYFRPSVLPSFLPSFLPFFVAKTREAANIPGFAAILIGVALLMPLVLFTVYYFSVRRRRGGVGVSAAKVIPSSLSLSPSSSEKYTLLEKQKPEPDISKVEDF
jgi:hypothetical protein